MDLVGKRFDKLLVINYEGKTNYRTKKWKCKCDCGKECIRTEQALLDKNHKHSCGCITNKNLIPGDSSRCSKAGKERAAKRNVNGINVDMLMRNNPISTNTSGIQGVSWSNTAHKWHTYVGYKSYRCNLGYYEDINDAKKIHKMALDTIRLNTFEDFFYELRGFRIEDKLTKQSKKG